MVQTICVAGAGTMGSGIALVAAQSGFRTLLFDLSPEVLEKSASSIQHNIDHLIHKQKISGGEGVIIFKRIQFISDTSKCVADFFIEAIIEKADAKIELFNQFAAINTAGAIFATNTSSLSVSRIQAGIVHPERVAGMHFFNPAPVMKLVEVVSGGQTSEATTQTVYQLCKAMGKTPVFCQDAPGFIVNRVARHYYLEAMKIVETGIATIENVDALMEASGFKMGPFKLMDLIGIDINLAVSKSLYEAFNYEERFVPSALQEDKVAMGELGRKTGKGFYNYS
ncbi:MAG: 3-hydroxybutyryl-CoA dehydrogenase [Ferruginibacter sp.]|nr:3-hydroxybutyryl-CoA dehydrogenase [Ferruginibacter sp.]